jgi:predicted deacylase
MLGGHCVSIESFLHIKPGPGEIAHGWVEVPGVDPTWQMPVAVARGREPGPTLALTAGVHACEYVAMEALRRFVMTVDRAQLAGTIIAILMVNTPGFPDRTVFLNPRDTKNINRVFPGSKAGGPAERVADFLMTELIAKCDAYIDCHGGDMVEALHPFTLWVQTGNRELDAKSEAMAAAYGETMIFSGPVATNRGMAFAEAAAIGVPAMLGEAGQQGICDEDSVDIHIRGMQSVLGVLSMAKEVSGRKAPQVMAEEVWLSSSTTGLFHPMVSLGDAVEAGQRLGAVMDVFGETLEEIVAPRSGNIFVLLTGLAVNAGEALMEIGVKG